MTHSRGPLLPVLLKLRTILLLLLGTMLTGMTACTPFNYTAADAPQPLASMYPLKPKPRIALVLGAGGPRGFAHIGVMRALEDAGIEFDLVVGTSVGSLIGVFWASGLNAEEIDQRSLEGGPLTIFDPSLFADRGWIRGQRLQEYVNTELNGKRLEELPRPVVVVATQRDNKKPRFFTHGNSGVAVRASSAMPGIISPVGIQGIEYEDGDVSLPLAVSAARAAGADFVIAVNVYPRIESTPPGAKQKLRNQNARRQQQIEAEIHMADFVIHPDTPYHASPRRRFFEQSRRIGEAEANARLPALLAALSR